LSRLKSELYAREMYDPTNAFRFGNLIDAMITEPKHVDFFQRTLGEYQFTKDDFEKAERMKAAFYADKFCREIAEKAEAQKVMVKHREFDYDGFEFELDTRCKWDIWRPDWGWGGDIKSTSATTQAGFENAARHFDYDRQAAWYMDIAGSDLNVIIGISKVNFKVFKISINRQSRWYLDGFNKYNFLSFKWHLIYGQSN
jgi:hypothetical protein